MSIHLFIHWTFLSRWHGQGSVIDTVYQTQTALKELADGFLVVRPEPVRQKEKYCYLFITTEFVITETLRQRKVKCHSVRLDQWFSRCRPCASNIGFTWELVRNTKCSGLALDLLLWWSADYVLATLPDSFGIFSAWELFYSNYCDTIT